MMMKKIKLKDSVSYFDLNCFLEQIDSNIDQSSSLKSNFFILKCFYSYSLKDEHFVYESHSFISCKRHLKEHFVLSVFKPLIYRVYYVNLSPTGLRSILGYVDYYSNFNFVRHEQLCEV